MSYSKIRKFIFEVDENKCPFSNSQYCNHPMRTGSKFCISYGDLSKRQESCKLIEVETEYDDCVCDCINYIENKVYLTPDWPFEGWAVCKHILAKLYGFTKNWD